MFPSSQLLPFQGIHFLVAHKKVEIRLRQGYGRTRRKHAALKNFLRNNGSLR